MRAGFAVVSLRLQHDPGRLKVMQVSAQGHDIHQTHRTSAGGSVSKRRDGRRGVLAEQLQPRVGRPCVDEWVAEAFTHTVVERIDSPPGFLADCVVAPGAITVGRSEQEARDEMRSALADWANLRVARGYDLPELDGGAAAP